MKQDMFVDVEQGFSNQNLNLLNKAVNAFAEFDPLVARVLVLAEENTWPREFALATIAYYVLHRHKDEYHGTPADGRTPVSPVRIAVEMQEEVTKSLRDLLKIMETHPPLALSGNGQPPVCALCQQGASKGHKEDCELKHAMVQAQGMLRAA